MKRSWQIFWHIFFWVSLISLFMYLGSQDMKMSVKSLLVVYLLYPVINISLFYTNFLVLIPQFFNKKRYTFYFIAIAITIVIFGLIKYGFGLIFTKDVLQREYGHTINFLAY